MMINELINYNKKLIELKKMTPVFFCLFCDQVRVSAMKPPAVMAAPATTTATLSAAPARLAGKETRATQVTH